MNDGSSLPPELDACHRLIEQLAVEREQLAAQLEYNSAEREQLSSRLQLQEAFVEEQSRTVLDLADSRQQLSQENEELKLTVRKLMGDCWSGFQKIELRSDSRIRRGACWAHARRKLNECRENHPRHTTVLLALIRELYDLEDRAKLWPAERRLELRQRESVRVLNHIRTYIDGPELARLVPKSDLAEAIGYLKNNWDALLLYTTDGRFPIDNNETEHLMKQVRAPTRSGWSEPEELAAHWQLGGGRPRRELDDDHRHGGAQRPGRLELSQRTAGPNVGGQLGLGIAAGRSLETTASRSGTELSSRRTARRHRPSPRSPPPPADKQEDITSVNSTAAWLSCTVALERGVHVLVVDLFPPGAHDPNAIHGEIRQRLVPLDDSFELPRDEPQTLISYVAGSPTKVYLNQMSVGDAIPDMSLFLSRERYVNAPLETTYNAAYQDMHGSGKMCWKERFPISRRYLPP